MSVSIPIKIYEILEDKLGRDEAKEIVKEIESAVDTVAFQKKIEVKDELGKDLLTRGEFHAEIKALKTELESKFRLYVLIIIFTILLVNRDALEIFARLLGIVK